MKEEAFEGEYEMGPKKKNINNSITSPKLKNLSAPSALKAVNSKLKIEIASNNNTKLQS